MHLLGQLMNSEYTNPSELLGLDADVNQELLGYLNSLDAVSKVKAINKLTKRHIPSHGSRAEFEKFFPELPANIKQDLLQGKLRLADHTVYSLVPIQGAKTIKVFQSQDIKEDGLKNIQGGRLPKGMVLLVSGIYMLQGVAGSTSNEEIKKTSFDTISAVPAIANGSFKLKSNKKQLVSETSNRKFINDGYTLLPKGYFKLNNPRLIQDDVDIEFEVDLGTVSGVDANAVLYVGLDGTATIP